MSDDLKVAETILAQIGGKALTMIGARQPLVLEREAGPGVQFKVGRNPQKVTHVRVVLGPDDTYALEFWHLRGASFRVVSRASGVYCDALATAIGDGTGLAVSL